MQRVLSGRGYEVLEARDIAHALQLAADFAGRIHLLLSDIVMPGLERPGPGAADDRAASDLRVLYMSGFSNRLSTERGSLKPA